MRMKWGDTYACYLPLDCVLLVFQGEIRGGGLREDGALWRIWHLLPWETQTWDTLLGRNQASHEACGRTLANAVAVKWLRSHRSSANSLRKVWTCVCKTQNNNTVIFRRQLHTQLGQVWTSTARFACFAHSSGEGLLGDFSFRGLKRGRKTLQQWCGGKWPADVRVRGQKWSRLPLNAALKAAVGHSTFFFFVF